MIVLLVMFTAVAVKGELYSAMAGMETLLDTQRVLINTMDDFIDETERKLETIKRLRINYVHLENVSRKNFQEFVSNPINAFVLIKKLSVDWDEVRKLMRCLPTTEIATSDAAVFPDYNDLSGAAKALLRVQQTYGLETADLSEGRIFAEATELSLSGDDCFELGRQAYYAGLYENAIPWLELAINKNSGENADPRTISEIERYLRAAEVEKEKSAIMLFTNNLLQLGFMSMNSLARNPSSSEKVSGLIETEPSNNAFMGPINFFDEASYRQLCQSSMQAVSAAYSSNLRCRMVYPHPFLLLQPVKEEELWIDPKISLYYEVISDTEMDILKRLALPTLQRAEVAEYSSSLGHRVSDTRVTKIAWLRKHDHPLIPNMYRRIEDVTGLSSVSAEPFQMANYGLGGHFHLHMDVLPDTEKYFGPDMGNRVATWMYYLSDVSGGGATVFPRLNISVWPKKGSALFWHNVNSDGVGNVLTLHGACPVVSGSKWVTNVWFHERGQEFKLKCGMRPESALQQMNPFKIS